MTKTISVPVELLDLSLNGDEQQQAKARNKLRALLAQPAEQPDLGQPGSADRYFFEAGYAKGKRDAEQPSAAKVPDDLDQRMKAAGMLSVAELLAGAPLDAFMKHAGVNDLATFAEWLEMRRGECIRMHARYDLGERDKGDDLYEWTIAHAAVFNEVHINFRAAQADAQRAIAELRELVGAAQRVTCAVIDERDTLRQQLAERDAQIASMRAEVTPFIETHWMPVARQRDKLAGLLREARELIDHGDFREGHCMCGSGIEWHGLGDGHAPVDAGEYYAGQIRERIDAALAELNT